MDVNHVKAEIERALTARTGTCQDMWALANWLREQADAIHDEAAEAAEDARRT